MIFDKYHQFSHSIAFSVYPTVLLVYLLLVLVLPTAMGQGEANHWFFGQKAGVDFQLSSTQVVIADTNGSLSTSEGCASISDASGNLLFYTDGDSAWAANHLAMPNGFGLGGNFSSTQSAIIVPKPLDADNYFIFTVDLQGASMYFSEVDMALNGGLGDVIAASKATLLADSVLEKITALPHANGIDYWAISHRHNSNEYIAFEVTSTGVNVTPVVSAIGTQFLNATPYTQGYMKGSPLGNQIAQAIVAEDSIELVDFDPATGTCSNPIKWYMDVGQTPPSSGSYGLDYSPNGRFVYTSRVASPQAIIQYDLQAGSAAAIQASGINVAPGLSPLVSLGCIQLGPDGHMYVTSNGASFLHRIEFPNVQGVGCNFNEQFIFLENRISFVGLPTFIPTFFRSRSFSTQGLCSGDSVFFSLDDTTGVDSVLWHFGDPASGIDSISTSLFSNHIFSDTGLFQVSVTIFDNGVGVTETNFIFIFPVPAPDLGPDVSFCQGDSVILNAGSFPLVNYEWEDNSTDSTLIVKTTGQYIVNLFNACDTVADTINVTVDQPFTFSLGNDTAICSNQPLVLNPGVVGATYNWQDNSTNPTFNVTTANTYRVTVSNTCDTLSDTLVVTVLSLPVAVLPNDTIICNGDSVTLTNPQTPGVNYQWSNLTTGPSITIGQTGSYWLFASGTCGNAIDTINLSFEAPATFDLGNDTTLCPGDTLVLNSATPGGTYLWDNGSITHDFFVVEDGIYSVTVSVGNCNYIDTIAVSYSVLACFVPIDCQIDLPNVFTPNYDGHNDFFGPLNDCQLTNYKLRVYNRWGQLVFDSEVEGISWDGFVAGRPAPAGVYFWILEFEDQVIVDEDRKDQTGSFTLLR